VAFPSDLNQVLTNLSQTEFAELVAALKIQKNPEIVWHPDYFLLAGMFQGDFTYRGEVYTLTEEFELVVAIHRVVF
jgi:hypothetical protein